MTVRIGRTFALLFAALLPLAASPQSLTITTFAGSTAGGGYVDAQGSAARFSFPAGIDMDAAGTMYVADIGNHVIRKVTRDGRVTTLAGQPMVPGAADGQGSAARFNRPWGVAVDGSGNVYVADRDNHAIRKITPSGFVTTFAGLLGTSGAVEGTGSAARFHFPAGLDVDGGGNVYVADTSNHAIRRITPAGAVTTLAGLLRTSGSSDGFGTQARFYFPLDVALDASGNVFVADLQNNTIRRVTQDGRVTTVAGQAGAGGHLDGTGTDSRFELPWSVDVDASGNVYVADTWKHVIRKITPAAVVTTLVGNAGIYGTRAGQGSGAYLNAPSGIVVDPAGGLFITDRFNQAIRFISATNQTQFFAGSVPQGTEVNATGTSARFFYPQGVAVDPSGNIYASTSADVIRKITPAGVTSTIAGAVDAIGSTDGPGTTARFSVPQGLASDSAGNIYIADTDNHTIRKMTPAGVVSTLAGRAGAANYQNGSGSQALFDSPFAVAVDHLGNVYVADTYNERIRIVEPSGVTGTLAGNGIRGWNDGVGEQSSFSSPTGVAVDANRNVYVADWGNNLIRKIAPNGQVTTVAGIRGREGHQDGDRNTATFNEPLSLVARPDGTLYVLEDAGNSIRRVDPAGNVTTVAGDFDAPGNVDGTGRNARLFFPRGIALDSQGRLIIADTRNHNIRIGTAAAPTIDSFTANPAVMKTPQPVTLAWTTSGGTSATLNGVNVSLSGTATVAPSTTTTYTLVVRGEGGTATKSVTVVIGSARRRSVR